MNKYNSLLLLAVAVFLLFSCGRRGDPVAVPRYDEKPVSAGVVQGSDDGKTVIKEEVPEKQLPPDAPEGLTGVYTEKNIVLVWDDVVAEGLKGYNIYRSIGKKFEIVGGSFIPAYTDNDIKVNITYYYKVTALGVFEGAFSKAIKIKTERRLK